jgi:calcineurin-like phosphoesterase family protein
MGNIWIVADTHWNHEKIAQYCRRPKDWQVQLSYNWCNTVQPEDTVIHLGDVIFNNASELPCILASLPGTKILVMGNHDKRSPEWYQRQGFALAVDSMVLDVGFKQFRYQANSQRLKHDKSLRRTKVVLVHDWMSVASKLPAGGICIHGHCHNNYMATEEHWSNRFYLLALGHVGYRPVLLSHVFVESAVLNCNRVKDGKPVVEYGKTVLVQGSIHNIYV